MNALATAPAINLSPAVARLQAAFAQHAGASMPVRRQAFEKFLQRGFPAARDEHWKYTNLRRLEAREFGIGQPEAAYLAPPTAAIDAYQLMFVDGWYRPALSTPPTVSGLQISSLAQLQRNDMETLASALAIAANDSSQFVALNTALTQDGVLIDAAANVILDKPILLTFAWSRQEASLMAHPRVVLRMGKHSKLCVVEQYVDGGTVAHFNNAVSTVQLADGAELEHCHIQDENTHTFHIGLLHADLAAHAKLTSHQVNFGAALARMDINVLLQGAEASVALNGLQFAGGHQHHDAHTLVEHCVPHTSSTEDYRGIADGRSRVVFNGKVMVHKKAVKTDAQQSSRNLLLATSAEIDTKPELEIYNDDVKCAHGATVGQLDANALFYLRSRGLDAAQARALLTQAFADHIISHLPIVELREQLTAMGHARFGAQPDATP
jgi:Fe-S cluster assembly protein SufD